MKKNSILFLGVISVLSLSLAVLSNHNNKEFLATKAEEANIDFTGSDYKYKWSEYSSFFYSANSDALTTTNGQFEISSETLKTVSSFSFVANERLHFNKGVYAIDPINDKRVESLTFGSKDSYVVSDDNYLLRASSVSFYWGMEDGFRIKELNSSGEIIVDKKIGNESSDIHPTGNPIDDATLSLISKEAYRSITTVNVDVDNSGTKTTFHFSVSSIKYLDDQVGDEVRFTFDYSATDLEYGQNSNLFYGRKQNSNKQQIQSEGLYLINLSATGTLIKEDYSKNVDKWLSLNNFTVADDLMFANQDNAKAVSTPIGGNSVISVDIDFTNALSTYGAVAIMFKGLSYEMEMTEWSYSHQTNEVTVDNHNIGNWLALVITDADVKLWSCVDGVAEPLDEVVFPGLDARSYSQLGNQLTEVKISTEDTETGVDVSMSLLASGNPANPSPTVKYSTTYSSANTALRGVQNIALDIFALEKEMNDINNNEVIMVEDYESSYSRDYYVVHEFETMVSNISYSSITKDNYFQIKSQYHLAEIVFLLMNDEQRGLVNPVVIAKYETIANDFANADMVSIFSGRVDDLVTQRSLLPTPLVTNKSIEYKELLSILDECTLIYNNIPDAKKSLVPVSVKNSYNTIRLEILYFEDAMHHVDIVAELIDTIYPGGTEIEITDYFNQRHDINKALELFNDLYNDEKELLGEERIHKLNALTEALTVYEETIRITGFNFAEEKDNFAELTGYSGFSSSTRGLAVNINSNVACVYSTKAVDNGNEVTFTIDSQLEKCSWGNFYFIFKSDTLARHHDSGKWLQEGNYSVLLVGGDGFKLTECIDGKLKMTTDSSGNPVADYLVDFGFPAHQYDVSKIYNSYTTVKIKTVNQYNEYDECIGYKATITIIGNSGDVIVKEYTSNNPHVENANYCGIELYLSNPISISSGGGFLLKGLEEEGVTSYNGKEMKQRLEDEQKANELNTMLSKLDTSSVTSNNYSTIKNAYDSINRAYNNLSAYAKSKIDPSEFKKLATVSMNLADYNSVKKVDEILSDLDDVEVDEENVQSIKELIAQAKKELAALSNSQKEKLTKDVSLIAKAESAVALYEHPLVVQPEEPFNPLYIILPTIIGACVLIGIDALAILLITNKKKKEKTS